jgi:hypothetical protein
MGYARVREEAGGQWESVEMWNMAGDKLSWTPEQTWAEAIAFDAMETGLYLLLEPMTDNYFLVHSIDLDYTDETPEELE